MYSAAPAGSHRHVRWGILPAALYKRQADRGRDRKVAIRWERYEARPNSARYNCSGPSLKVREARSLQDVLATQGKLKSGQLNDSLRAHVVDPKKNIFHGFFFFLHFYCKSCQLGTWEETLGFGDTIEMFTEDFFREKNPLLQMCLAFLKANLNVLHFEKALVPTHYQKNQLAETHNPSQGTTNQKAKHNQHAAAAIRRARRQRNL